MDPDATEILPVLPEVSAGADGLTADDFVTEEPSRKPITTREFIVGYGLSMLLHITVLIVAAAILVPLKRHEEIFSTVLQFDPPLTDRVQLDDLEQLPDPAEIRGVDSVMSKVNTMSAVEANPLESLNVNDLAPKVNELGNISVPELEAGDHLAGRSAAARSFLVRKYGGSDASEAAVANGLKWLARIQHRDGAWSFSKIGGSRDPGLLTECETGATAFALLAFLGAGHTHQEGAYQQTVQQGLAYLLGRQEISALGGDLRGTVTGNEGMYVHGLATIAVCEAFALTEDRRLRNPARAALKFIDTSQHAGGGWRYQPLQAGDTSVVGWQIMALTSGKLAKVPIPAGTLPRAKLFLDSVQIEEGAKYGYTTPAGPPSTTAIGLLCRMYMGWDADNPALGKGVAFLDDVGPSRTDMYYNYYATQVLHHWGGAPWDRWNAVLRDRLVGLQIKQGREAGSWDPTDPHAGPGGRLYQTALCIMTLEVYYRHLPLYQRRSIPSDF